VDVKRSLLVIVLVLLLPAAAQAPVEAPSSQAEEALREAGFKLPHPKGSGLPALVGEKADAYAVSHPVEVEPDTGEKIEKATEEVGKALGPIGQLLAWLSDLPGYWEAFLVGAAFLVGLFLLYGFVMLGVKGIMKKRGKPEWRLARRYNVFLRILLISIAVLVALVWTGVTEGWFYTVVTSVASLSAAFLLINVFSYFFLERRRAKRQGKPLPALFQQVVRGFAYIVAVVAIVGAATDLDLSALLASSAVLSLVLGLALQDTLGNVFAGMSIQASKPFEIGDWVAFKEFEGQVVQMNWREVRIRTFDGDDVVLPNSVVASSDLCNYSHPTTKHVADLFIGTSYQDPPEKVRAVVREVLEDMEGIDPAQQCLYLMNYKDFSIEYRVRFFIYDYSRLRNVRAEVMNRLWYAFKRAGITIPFPIRDIYHHQVDERAQEELSRRALVRRTEMLHKVDLFSPLEPEVFDKLARAFKTLMFARREIVIEQGEEGDTFYLIGSGRFEVYLKRAKAKHRFGVKVAELGTGDFFGEMSLLTGEARTATVVAAEESEVYALGKEDFREILQGHPEVSAQLASAASERVTQNLAQLSKYLTDDEQKTMAENEKTDRVRRAILGQMREFFGF
jgi:small-conductance mechanosensitive channel/CRP-like cAMP-binding protein